jgi:membrane protein
METLPRLCLAWRKCRRALVAAGRNTASQRVSLSAAGCAFYATLALFPAITMLISLYGLVYDPASVQPQLHYLQGFMPPTAFQLISDRIQQLVSAPSKRLGLGFALSLAIAFWSSNSGTKSIINALSLAYHESETRGVLRFYLVTFSMTLVAILGTALAIGFLVAVPVALAHLGVSLRFKFLVNAISSATMVLFILLAIGVLYRFGPAGGRRALYAPGALVATALWLAMSWLFGFYVGHFAAYSITYGPLATLIGLMMWFYWSAYVILFGAELNAALEREWRAAKPAAL